MLPPLPVPPLQKSLSRYVRSLAPLLDETELAHSQAAVAEFGRPGGDGERLQALLEQRAEAAKAKPEYPNAHWLEEPWDNLAYLADRSPLVGGTNIFGTLLSCSAHPQPLRRAAILIHCTVRFHLDLQSGAICPDSLDTKGKIPLCMFQFERLFGCSRVPGDPMDKFVKAANARHVAVLSHGRVAAIEVVTADGKAVSPDELEPRLHAFATAAERECGDSWTMLSSLPRSEWAQLCAGREPNRSDPPTPGPRRSTNRVGGAKLLCEGRNS